MICALHDCNMDIPSDRVKRRYVTCSAQCGAKHSGNLMAISRAKRKGKVAVICKNCFKYFTDHKNENHETCNKCRGINLGPKTDKTKTNYNYNPVGKGVGGKYFEDFRLKICINNGVQCDKFVKCSDSLFTHKDGAFEYQTNGGRNCYVKPNRIKINTIGNPLAVHMNRC